MDSRTLETPNSQISPPTTLVVSTISCYILSLIGASGGGLALAPYLELELGGYHHTVLPSAGADERTYLAIIWILDGGTFRCVENDPLKFVLDRSKSR